MSRCGDPRAFPYRLCLPRSPAGARFILGEKPLAASRADCDRMLAACRRHGVRLAVNHQMRFMEQYTEPKRLVQTEEFGGLSSVIVIAGSSSRALRWA